MDKLNILWNDKSSVKNRNDFIIAILPRLKHSTSYKFFIGKNKESAYTNSGDALSDAILVLLREWHNYTDIELFLKHIFGYIKYYQFQNKYHQQKYLACEYEFMERLGAKYFLQASNAKTEAILKNLPSLEREILEMFVLDGWSKKEIGDRLGISEVLVDQKYKKALKLCRLSKVKF